MASDDQQLTGEDQAATQGLRIGIPHPANGLEESQLTPEEMKQRLAQAQSFYNRTSN
jgi:hypothetical protein